MTKAKKKAEVTTAPTDADVASGEESSTTSSPNLTGFVKRKMEKEHLKAATPLTNREHLAVRAPEARATRARAERTRIRPQRGGR